MQPEMRTTRRDPLTAGALDNDRASGFVTGFAARGYDLHPFAGERTIDKHHLAIAPSDSPAREIDRFDLDRIRRCPRDRHCGGSSTARPRLLPAARYPRPCCASRSARAPRTRAFSARVPASPTTP